jgi:transcriptional regulator with XRE-family HTH domain
MGKAAGVTAAAISLWESNGRAPREEALAKLAAYLGVTPAFLRYGVEPTAAPRARVDYGRRSTATPADAPLMAQPTPAKKRA